MILLKSGTRQGCLLSAYLFNIVFKVLTRAIRQQRRSSGYIRKEVKHFLFADDILVYISDPKNLMRELLQLINNFGNVAGHKFNSKELVSPSI